MHRALTTQTIAPPPSRRKQSTFRKFQIAHAFAVEFRVTDRRLAHRLNQNSLDRKPLPPAFASAARECSAAKSSRISLPFSPKCPRRHPTAPCKQTSQSSRLLRLKSTTRISLLASSVSPCTIVTANQESFHRRDARQTSTLSRAKVSRQEKRPCVQRSHLQW